MATESPLTIDWIQPTTYVDTLDVIELTSYKPSTRATDGWLSERRDRMMTMLADHQHRPTDAGVFVSLLSKAIYEENFRLPTSRQWRALHHRDRAVACGLYRHSDVYRFVGDAMGISRTSAFKLCKRADERMNLETLRPKMEQTIVSPYIHHEADDEADANLAIVRERSIQRMMASLPRDCPGAGHEVCKQPRFVGKFQCCPSCYREWGILAEKDQPAWFRYSRQASLADLRQRAIEALNFVELPA